MIFNVRILDYTPLHGAATRGHLEVVKILVEAGARIHKIDIHGILS